MQQLFHTQRLAELQDLLAEGDLSRLSRRLLDFLADVPAGEQIRGEAIALRAAYNAHISREQADRSTEELARLHHQANDLIAFLQEQLSEDNADSLSTGDSWLTEEVLDQVELRDNSIVFDGKKISKRFVTPKHTFELPNLDLQLRLGEITGIVGENGNGKTTLLRIVAGELSVSSGTVAYPWFPVQTGDWYRIKQHIAFIPQHLPAWQGYLKQNLHFAAAIHGIKGHQNETLVEFVIHRLGLTKYEDALWSEISSGFKLRFELARALVRRPHLLIIDEPLANLDINTQEVFLQDLKYLAKSVHHPMAILLSSQHLHELETIADNIIFIKNGEALYNGSMKDFGQDRQENIFELSTTTEKTILKEALSQLEGVTIEDRGTAQIIRTPIDLEGNVILGALVSAQVQIGYFRDISTSTLKLFRE
ncbi:MAG: ABC transporter ATP-binding protein [Bacteroidota bacterium]